MAITIYSITPDTGYFAGTAKSATLSIADDNPKYTAVGGGIYVRYDAEFYLFSVISGGTSLGKIGTYSLTYFQGEEPVDFIGNVTTNLTVPSGTAVGTYYVGGLSGGTRKSITVSPNSITVSFDLNGGSGTTPNNLTQTTGSLFTLPSSASFYKTGYSALEWNTTSGGNGSSYNFNTQYNFYANTTLFVKWQLNQYTMVFNSNGGTAVSSIVANYGAEITQPNNPSKTGYSFVGWYSDVALTNVYYFTTMPAENIVIYAKWVINSYTMSFATNGGNSINDITQNYNTTIAVSNPNRIGYTFAGWFLDAGLNNAYTITTMPAFDITLYAKWDINSYSVKFFNDLTQISSSSLNYGTNIVAPIGTPIKTDSKNRYIFLGWNTDINAEEAMVLGTVPANDINFYAIYDSFISSLKINAKDVNLMLGDTQIKAIYQGETMIWQDYHEE